MRRGALPLISAVDICPLVSKGADLIIRSYRRVFRVDRRIYRVDRWYLPVPGGIPLVGLAYFAATVLLVVVLGRVPGIGEALGTLSPPLRYVVLPFGVALFASRGSSDGRSAHRFAWQWLRFRLRRERRPDLRWDGRVATRWDADAPHLHRARVRGVARVDFAVPVTFGYRWRRLSARSGDTVGPVVLGAEGEMEIRA